MIGIIDYGLGNVKAFHNIYKENGIDLKIIQNYKDFDDSINKLILPGIGSFDKAAELLKQNSFFEKILEFVSNEKRNKILGICVGMQLLASGSEEGKLKGFNFIKDKFTKIKSNILPHIGWNNIDIINSNNLFDGINDKSFFYFLHSYCLKSENRNYITCETTYDQKFVSAFNYKNIYGIQFHPEKSHTQGEKILLNFFKN